MNLPQPAPLAVDAWFTDRARVAAAAIDHGRSRNAALRNLDIARDTWMKDPCSLPGEVFHAWRFTSGLAGYTARRAVREDPVTVAFDCDGVLYSFNNTLRTWLEGRGWSRDDMPEPTVYSLNDAWGLSNRTLHREMPLAIRAGVLWHEGEAFVEGTSAARSLGEAGHRVVVNTARSLEGMEQEATAATITWLRSHGVHPDGLHLADPFVPEDKLGIAFDVLFDDHPENVRMAINAGRRAYVVAQPWNENATDLPRAEYSEIESIVERLREPMSV